MDTTGKREHDDNSPVGEPSERPDSKCIKKPRDNDNSRFAHLKHGKGRPIPKGVLNKLTDEDLRLLESVKTSCTDLEEIKAAIQLRIKHRLSIRLPEDLEDSSYYMDNGLRRVYPYNYLYQSYVKRRWIGRKLKDVLTEEFRDIPDDQMKMRFQMQRILVNGSTVDYNYVLKDNDFVANRSHRHELPVLATPIKIIHLDKETLVINKPPSVPIHPCGRYRHNTVVNILARDYGFRDIKVVHRLDRLVSGVLILALNSGRANLLESSIKNRDVQKEYVCRVMGEFPDGEIIVDQPLEIIPGKIGITVVLAEGKDSVTKFKRLNYNGKTSAVLCKPKTGRMHQIRVHLQYLGHPIVNDSLYNCASFGPERGKGGKYGKSLKQLSADVIATHRASTWVVSEDNDIIGDTEVVSFEPDVKTVKDDNSQESDSKVIQFISEDERKETMEALGHFFSDESWKSLKQKCKFEQDKLIKDPTCRDCSDKFHDPPPRSLFLYLHALKYSGVGWSYESEMPVWAQESWKY